MGIPSARQRTHTYNMAINPPTIWAQRSSEDEETKNVLLITLEVPELEDGYTLEFPNDERLVFKGKSATYPSAGHTEEAKEYALDLELFDKVNGEGVKKSLTGKSLFITVPKKELKIEYWPRLTKDKAKLQFVKTDFSKWVDEDEQDAAEDIEMPEDPMGGMGAQMGMGGAGGMQMPNMGLGGGAGGLDMEALLKQFGGGAGGQMPDMSSFGAEGDEDGDEDDDEIPPLEDSSDSKGKASAQDDMPPLEEA